MEKSELLAKVEQWLRDVSAALHRLSRERQVLPETRTQITMGVMPANQADRLTQWRDSDCQGLQADIVARLRRAGL